MKDERRMKMEREKDEGGTGLTVGCQLLVT